jgi:hypothetical protein
VLAPSPGDSEVLQAFYRQEHQLSLPTISDSPAQAPELNLMVLWDISLGFVELFASCPAHGANSRKSVQEYWWRAMPHTSSAVAPAFGGYAPAPIGYEAPANEDEGTGTGGSDD